MFIRIFMATTGVITTLSGLAAVGLTAFRTINPPPVPVPVPRALLIVFTFSFLLSFTLVGVCWVMAAMSKRLWNSTS